jgi:NAD(P)H-nitrite reductase large subunit
MNLDDKICYCYHVSLRKLVNFANRERPKKASQMSQCLGAGTGCGWCIPILKKIQAEAATSRADSPPIVEDLPDTAEAYASGRQTYLKSPDKNAF